MKPYNATAFECLQAPGNITLAPDGSTAVFSLVKADISCDAYQTSFWLLHLGDWNYEELDIPNGTSSFSYITPDTLLLSLPSENNTIFYRFYLSSHKKEKLFEIPVSSASGIFLDKDLFLISTCQTDSFSSDYEECTTLHYRMDGVGFLHGMRQKLSVYDCSQENLFQITPPYFSYTTYHWDKISHKLYYSGKNYLLSAYEPEQIYEFSSDTMSSRKMTDFPYSVCSFASIENSLYIWSVHLNGDEDVYHLSLSDCSLSLFYKVDAAIGWYLDTDAALNGGSFFEAHDNRLWFTFSDRSGTRICTLKNQQIEYQSPTGLHVHSFRILPDETIICVGAPEFGPLEIFRLDHQEWTPITNFHKSFVAEYALNAPSYFPYSNRHETLLDGWIVKPANYDSKKTYPGFLLIHGGPRGRFAGIMNSDIQFLSSQGFFVFYTNPHGSSSVTREFANIENHFGTIDYEDLMDFTDIVLEKTPNLDPSRLAVGGVSYGGFMTNWIIGHTNRFKSAISMSSISNWLTMYGTSDLPECVNNGCLSGTPWNNFDTYWESSPIRYAGMIQTPALFLQGSADYRCPPEQPEQMYAVLKRNKICSKIVLFENQGHHWAINGTPSKRVLRYREIENWLTLTIKKEEKRYKDD